VSKLLRVVGAMVSNLALLSGMAMAGTPVHYEWSGMFEPGLGIFNGRSFMIAFTVTDPSVYSADYPVNASLSISGIGAWQQDLRFDFADYTTTTVALFPFTNLVQTGDAMGFGICTGGSCNDPVLWNGDPNNPLLNTGSFALGLDSSCTLPGACDNAIANWFDGDSSITTTRYVGTLVVTSVPEPGPGALWLLGLAGVGLASKLRAARSNPPH
jgi:hypothetical protein